LSTATTTWGTDQTTSIAASTVTSGGGTATTGEIDNNSKMSAEVLVEITFHASSDLDVDVYLLRHSGSAYQDVNDNPDHYVVPLDAGNLAGITIPVDAFEVRKFEILVANPGAQDVTATVNYRQSVVTVT